MTEAVTKFASAERAPASLLKKQQELLLDMEMLDKLYEAVNEIIFILNQQRQIVFCNRSFAKLLGYTDHRDLLGMRAGEALGCMHAGEVDGCGTSESCSACGAIAAILSAQQGKGDVQECRVLRDAPSDAMDLRIRATPLTVKNEGFTIFAAVDISHEKRRNALERVFFHDLLH